MVLVSCSLKGWVIVEHNMGGKMSFSFNSSIDVHQSTVIMPESTELTKYSWVKQCVFPFSLYTFSSSLRHWSFVMFYVSSWKACSLSRTVLMGYPVTKASLRTTSYCGVRSALQWSSGPKVLPSQPEIWRPDRALGSLGTVSCKSSTPSVHWKGTNEPDLRWNEKTITLEQSLRCAPSPASQEFHHRKVLRSLTQRPCSSW